MCPSVLRRKRRPTAAVGHICSVQRYRKLQLSGTCMPLKKLQWLNVIRVPLQFIMLTYIFMLAWLGVTAFTSLPVFIYFNIWNICQNATVLEGATLCLDPRQYGKDGYSVSISSTPPPFLFRSQSHLCCTVQIAAIIFFIEQMLRFLKKIHSPPQSVSVIFLLLADN